jgi:hypothetical protein
MGSVNDTTDLSLLLSATLRIQLDKLCTKFRGVIDHTDQRCALSKTPMTGGDGVSDTADQI